MCGMEDFTLLDYQFIPKTYVALIFSHAFVGHWISRVDVNARPRFQSRGLLVLKISARCLGTPRLVD